MHTFKTVNGTKHTYYYAGGKLLRETYGSNTLDFFYDSNGHAYALNHNDTIYYYITNLQGDVMSIVNGQGLVVATYKYDPYGNLVSGEPAANSIGAINPIRYRGYYYDTDSQLYYLQSRYYDPELGRFLNADAFASTGQGILGMNMFAYCNNNPISSSDPKGNVPIFPVCIGEDRYIYITDQEKEPIGSKRFGIAKVSHSGCGAVASYNAMLSLGNLKSFDAVLDYYNGKMLSTLGWGCVGLRPLDIANFFVDQGYSVIIATDSTAIDAYAQTADACIMYYEYPASYLGFISAYGAHFVEFHKMESNYEAVNTSAIGGISIFENPSDYGNERSRYNSTCIFIYKKKRS